MTVWPDWQRLDSIKTQGRAGINGGSPWGGLLKLGSKISKVWLPMESKDLGFPNGTDLLAAERLSRQKGSGLTPESLEATWRLDQLWGKQRSAPPMATTAALLRSLKATLCIRPGPEPTSLRIHNSIQLGTLQLHFEGPGQLTGKRPLLVFWFEQLEVRLGPWLLIQRALPKPAETKWPFFALISSGTTGSSTRDIKGKERWLAARGRGGGLALWRS
jgi:hypothetical protein